VATGFGIFWRTACLLLLPCYSHAQTEAWQPVEQFSTYGITGDSGVGLYASIGERGPKIGAQVRAIAHTDFKLTWTRKYEPQPDGSCKIAVARPKLIITYMLPKPAVTLAPDLKTKWDVFIAGVRKHEAVHGVMITDMVKEIERVSLAISAPNDPKCAKLRADLQTKLGEISRAQRQRSADFDKMEMSDGGNVHQLILHFVNGK